VSTSRNWVVRFHGPKPAYHLFDTSKDIGFLVFQMLALIGHLEQKYG
jgi:hypothetical protein